MSDFNQPSERGGRWPQHPRAERSLPFPSWWPILAGVTAGLILRALVFVGRPGGPFAAMMGSFIYLAPLLVGAVTVYFTETIGRRSWSYYVAASVLASMLFIIGTLLIMIEGLICAIVIVPLFAMMGLVGGLIMGAVCRMTNWPRPTLCGLAVLPLLLGGFETQLPLPDHIETVERTLLIQAPPAVIWERIHDTPSIDPAAVANTWIYRMGAPLPRSGISRETAQGQVRVVHLQKGAHFEQEFFDWQPYSHARWRYRFTPDSFPPGTLDEHVVIGGHYFDLQEGELRMTPRGNATAVTLRIRYRVSTQFNWYASPLARALVGNLEESILTYYRQCVDPAARSES